VSTPIGLQRLEGAVERLDAPDADLRDVESSLADLARINRLLGGNRLTLRALGKVLEGRDRGPLTLLDAGSGGGDMAAEMAAWARRRGFVPHVIGIDASPSITALAAVRVDEDVELRVGDMRELDLPGDSVDVATCSLVIHHLEPPEAVQALRELRRVARVGVVVNDLVRTRMGLVGAHVVIRALTRNPITRHDAVVSVRRAYTRSELLGLASGAGLRPVDVRGTLGYRVAIAAEPA
jgi:2-polyprenyl-3-methyl-5-hydroxy-6-metoxy-1,4-benzoquinol methylase